LNGLQAGPNYDLWGPLANEIMGPLRRSYMNYSTMQNIKINTHFKNKIIFENLLAESLKLRGPRLQSIG